jgi:hypothetical protein
MDFLKQLSIENRGTADNVQSSHLSTSIILYLLRLLHHMRTSFSNKSDARFEFPNKTGFRKIAGKIKKRLLRQLEI